MDSDDGEYEYEGEVTGAPGPNRGIRAMIARPRVRQRHIGTGECKNLQRSKCYAGFRLELDSRSVSTCGGWLGTCVSFQAALRQFPISLTSHPPSGPIHRVCHVSD